MPESHDNLPATGGADPLDALLSALCDGTPQPEIYQQLNQRLTEDAPARQKYLDCLLVHAMLAWDGSATEPAGRSDTVRAVVPPLTISGQGILSGLANWSQPRFSLLVVLVAALFSSAATVGLLRWQRQPIAVPTLARQPATQPAEFVATLVSAADVRWDRAGQPVPNGARLPAGEVHIAEGVIEIMFDSGVKVVLEGPARFVPQSSRSGLLRSGKLVAQCPAGSPPFAVQTSTAVAAGAGAEFACEVKPDGATKVHVFDGQVEVAGRTHGGDPQARDQLGAGEALLVSTSPDVRLARLAGPAGEYVRRLPQHRRHFPMGLVAYWNFDEQGGPAFDSQGHNHGLLQGIQRTAGLVGGGALDFGGRSGQQVSVGAEGDAFRFATGLAIEALFVSRWSGKEGDYDEIFRKEDGNRRVLLSFQNDRAGNQVEPKPVPPRPVLALGLNVAGVYSELELPLDGQQGRLTVAQLTDGHVHHVVATYDAASGRKAIYLDGALGAHEQFAPGAEIHSGGSQPASIGNTFGGWEPFTGVLDEVAVYTRALSAAEIAEHWQQVQRGRGYFEMPQEAGAEHPEKSPLHNQRSI